MGMPGMNPEVRVFQDLEFLSRAAARIFSQQARQSIDDRGRFLVALNGGSTPERLFQLLVADPLKNVNWDKTHVFWGDERCVPPGDAESNYGQARGLLLGRVDIPDGNIHRIRGELSPQEASKEYVHVLGEFASPPLEWPHFDLVLLGMGEDGHTASLFPGSPLTTSGPVMAVTAHYQDRPAERVTFTPMVINSARLVLFMAVGANKAQTLSKVLVGPHLPELYPAQRIKPIDGELVWLVDEAAAGQLPKSIFNAGNVDGGVAGK
jgi:6-phosphogluconolactonase